MQTVVAGVALSIGVALAGLYAVSRRRRVSVPGAVAGVGVLCSLYAIGFIKKGGGLSAGGGAQAPAGGQGHQLAQAGAQRFGAGRAVGGAAEIAAQQRHPAVDLAQRQLGRRHGGWFGGGRVFFDGRPGPPVLRACCGCWRAVPTACGRV